MGEFALVANQVVSLAVEGDVLGANFLITSLQD